MTRRERIAIQWEHEKNKALDIGVKALPNKCRKQTTWAFRTKVQSCSSGPEGFPALGKFALDLVRLNNDSENVKGRRAYTNLYSQW